MHKLNTSKKTQKVKSKSNSIKSNIKTKSTTKIQKRSSSTTLKQHNNHSGTFLQFNGKRPQVTTRTYTAPTATIIGDVTIGPESVVLSNVCIRGDNDVISIGHHSNVQENSMLHTDKGLQLIIGNYVTIGHQAMIHGCTIGDNTIIGMGATVMNRAKIGKNCIIGAGALVVEGKDIPDGSVVVGAPGKIVRQITDNDMTMIHNTAMAYVTKVDSFFDMVEVQPLVVKVDAV